MRQRRKHRRAGRRAPERGISYQERIGLLKRTAQFLGEDGHAMVAAGPQVGRKLSEVLLEFAGPVTQLSEDPDHVRKAIGFAICVWNMALFPREELDGLWEEFLAAGPALSGSVRREMRAVLDMLIERKLTLYPHDRRLVANYEFVGEGNKRRLLVASMPVSLTQDSGSGGGIVPRGTFSSSRMSLSRKCP